MQNLNSWVLKGFILSSLAVSMSPTPTWAQARTDLEAQAKELGAKEPPPVPSEKDGNRVYTPPRPVIYAQYRQEKLTSKESETSVNNLVFILCHQPNYGAEDQSDCSKFANDFTKQFPLPGDKLELQRYEAGLILHLGSSKAISAGNVSQFDFYTIGLLSSSGSTLSSIPKDCLEDVDLWKSGKPRSLDFDNLNACMIRKIIEFRNKAATIH